MALAPPPTKRKARDIGKQAEQFALQFLQARGMRLVTQNFHCRFGEIDLILQDNGTLVFAEVRYRKHKNYGTGADSVDARKQQKLLATAAYFLQKNPTMSRYPCRFDVISLSAARCAGNTMDTTNTHIDWIPNAFQAG
jgi:putative endonuclease